MFLDIVKVLGPDPFKSCSDTISKDGTFMVLTHGVLSGRVIVKTFIITYNRAFQMNIMSSG